LNLQLSEVRLVLLLGAAQLSLVLGLDVDDRALQLLRASQTAFPVSHTPARPAAVRRCSGISHQRHSRRINELRQFRIARFAYFCSHLHRMQSTYGGHCYRRSGVVCLCVCPCVGHDQEPAKMAEPIDMPFGEGQIRTGQRNRVLDGARIPQRKEKL